MKTIAKARHSTPVATSQFCDEGESVKLGCCPGGGLNVGVMEGSISARFAIALFVQCNYKVSCGAVESRECKVWVLK